MSNYIILLPPSENKADGGNNEYISIKDYNSNNSLHKQREYLYTSLLSYINNASIDGLKAFFGITKDNLALQAKELLQNHHKEKTFTAIERYTGVMFKYLDYHSLNQQSKQNAEDSMLIIDGLFGLLAITDLIPNYKLPIGSKFKTSNQIFNIAKYWKENLKHHFKATFSNKIVLDILPQSHREVIDNEIIQSHNNYYKINFYEMKNNTPKNSGHISKQLKGEFIRYILSFNEIDLNIIQSFQHSKGYKYSEEISNGNDIVFLGRVL